MMLALAVIGLTAALVALSARLGDAQRRLAQAGRESAEQDRRTREEQAALQHGIAMTLACLLAGLAAASWHTSHAQARTSRFTAGACARPGAGR